MRVLICPDSFGGTLSAASAADAMAAGFGRFRSDLEFVLRPLSDGGPGFVAALHSALGGQLRQVMVHGPLGDEVAATWLQVAEVGYIESAQAIGLQLLERPDAMRASSYGLGELIAKASAKVDRLVIGVGGTAVSDGGSGMLAALAGHRFDPSAPLCGGAARLPEIEAWPEVSSFAPEAVQVATDVEVPLHGSRGAARGFAPQKGASAAEVELIAAGLEHWAALAPKRRRDPALELGAGAGGGTAFGLISLGGQRVSGAGAVFAAGQLADQIAAADLVVTGEGRVDWQTETGKLVAGCAALSQAAGKPAVVLAGEIDLTVRELQALGLAAGYSLVDFYGEERAKADAWTALADAAQRVARTWLAI